jgi:hypothetical protein
MKNKKETMSKSETTKTKNRKSKSELVMVIKFQKFSFLIYEKISLDYAFFYFKI